MPLAGALQGPAIPVCCDPQGTLLRADSEWNVLLRHQVRELPRREVIAGLVQMVSGLRKNTCCLQNPTKQFLELSICHWDFHWCTEAPGYMDTHNIHTIYSNNFLLYQCQQVLE